jgi:hypothetical protein
VGIGGIDGGEAGGVGPKPAPLDGMVLAVEEIVKIRFRSRPLPREIRRTQKIKGYLERVKKLNSDPLSTM